MTAYLADSNVLLALIVSGHEHHAGVEAWFSAIEEPASIFVCRATQQSFLRLLTTAAFHAQFGDRALTNAEAWAIYLGLLADDRISYQRDEPPELERWWAAFASRNTPSPKLWMDAYLAAFARAGSLQFVTADRAFRQFEGLDVIVLGEE